MSRKRPAHTQRNVQLLLLPLLLFANAQRNGRVRPKASFPDQATTAPPVRCVGCKTMIAAWVYLGQSSVPACDGSSKCNVF